MNSAGIHVNLYVCFGEEKIIVMSDIPFFCSTFANRKKST